MNGRDSTSKIMRLVGDYERSYSDKKGNNSLLLQEIQTEYKKLDAAEKANFKGYVIAREAGYKNEEDSLTRQGIAAFTPAIVGGWIGSSLWGGVGGGIAGAGLGLTVGHVGEAVYQRVKVRPTQNFEPYKKLTTVFNWKTYPEPYVHHQEDHKVNNQRNDIRRRR